MSDFASTSNVKRTRKIHVCGLCHEKIPLHTKAYFYKGQMDGEFYRYYLCPTCKTLTDEFPEVCYDLDGYLSDYDVAEYKSYYKCGTVAELLKKLREQKENAKKAEETDNLG